MFVAEHGRRRLSPGVAFAFRVAAVVLLLVGLALIFTGLDGLALAAIGLGAGIVAVVLADEGRVRER
jgi:hypothetical protein